MEYIVELFDSPATLLRQVEAKIVSGNQKSSRPSGGNKPVAKLLEVRIEFVIGATHGKQW